jgi:ribosome-binding protein aMBF1 (putative translation factor)
MDPRVDWEPVTLRPAKAAGKAPVASSYVDQGTAAARRAERETEAFRVATVETDVAREIRDLRAARGWTQKQLAAAVNERVDVIRGVEAGTAPPNGVLLVRLRRALRA